MKISLRRRHTHWVEDGSFSHKRDRGKSYLDILNLEYDPNCIIGSKVVAIFLNWWALPIGGVASRRVCACSLISRLVNWGVLIHITKKILCENALNIVLYAKKSCTSHDYFFRFLHTP